LAIGRDPAPRAYTRPLEPRSGKCLPKKLLPARDPHARKERCRVRAKRVS
jgi:hypothetical protein